jgi:hypothetical protein
VSFQLLVLYSYYHGPDTVLLSWERLEDFRSRLPRWWEADRAWFSIWAGESTGHHRNREEAAVTRQRARHVSIFLKFAADAVVEIGWLIDQQHIHSTVAPSAEPHHVEWVANLKLRSPAQTPQATSQNGLAKHRQVATRLLDCSVVRADATASGARTIRLW